MSDGTLFDFNFQDELLALAICDRQFLRDNDGFLSVDDFAPTMEGAPIERWRLAGIALTFWRKYREPVGRWLKVEVAEYIRDQSLHEKAANRLLEHTKKIVGMTRQPVPVEAVSEKLAQYKREKSKFDAVSRIMSHMQAGTLTDDVWAQLMRNALENMERDAHIVDYFADIENRIQRRKRTTRRFPYLMIDGFDEYTRSISFGNMGLIIAPWGRGKSLMFIHLAIAYVLQGLNVLLFTLEDKIEDVEDRLDAAIMQIAVKNLAATTDAKQRERFAYFQRLVRSRLKIVDGTNGDMSIQKIEATYERERDQGFRADVIEVDYDDEVCTTQKRQKRYEEFDDMYRDFRRMLGRTQTIGWIASQTGRDTEDMKIIEGNKVAGDISKMRKAVLVISLGKGDAGDESIFFWVVKHKLGVAKFGFNIIQNREQTIFYDRRRTLEMQKEQKYEAELKAQADGTEKQRRAS